MLNDLLHCFLHPKKSKRNRTRSRLRSRKFLKPQKNYTQAHHKYSCEYWVESPMFFIRRIVLSLVPPCVTAPRRADITKSGGGREPRTGRVSVSFELTACATPPPLLRAQQEKEGLHEKRQEEERPGKGDQVRRAQNPFPGGARPALLVLVRHHNCRPSGGGRRPGQRRRRRHPTPACPQPR